MATAVAAKAPALAAAASVQAAAAAVVAAAVAVAAAAVDTVDHQQHPAEMARLHLESKQPLAALTAQAGGLTSKPYPEECVENVCPRYISAFSLGQFVPPHSVPGQPSLQEE